ncbi:MAG: YCF48-related protein [Smithella sp.]|jgi:photosystem II stability/assembly factor-like uncharacterized protein
MAQPKSVYTAKEGEVFIQPGGPGPTNPLYSTGQCTDLDDISAPKATSEPIICRDKNSNFIQVGEVESPPGKITSALTILQGMVRSAIEKMQCPYSIYVVQKKCGKKGTYSDYELMTILNNVRNESVSYQNLVKQSAGDASAINVPVSAWFPELRVVGPKHITVERIATAETQALNDIAMNREKECGENCGNLSICEKGIIGADSAAGPATANVLFSDDEGYTWPAGAADPFGAGLHVTAVQRVILPGGGDRWIVSQEGTGGAAQGHTAYSDDGGATWTVVNIGGAAAGHGATKGGGLFALDYNHVWIASANGYIYFSSDGGATWTAQESGVITAGDYTQIHFVNEYYGVAGAPGDVIVFTKDGGHHWSAAAATGGGGDILAVNVISESKVFIGTDDGELWFSNDFGTTWAEITSFVGSGSGSISDIEFVNENVGWMIHNTAAPVGSLLRTVNGGFSWEKLTNLVTNAGLNALHVCDENNAFAVGEPSAGTAVIYRAYEG